MGDLLILNRRIRLVSRRKLEAIRLGKENPAKAGYKTEDHLPTYSDNEWATMGKSIRKHLLNCHSRCYVQETDI